MQRPSRTRGSADRSARESGPARGLLKGLPPSTGKKAGVQVGAGLFQELPEVLVIVEHVLITLRSASPSIQREVFSCFGHV
jgi:hypothetical protein